MTDLVERQRFNQDGEPVSLERLVRTDPDWAASRIRHREAEIERLQSQLEHACVAGAMERMQRQEAEEQRDMAGKLADGLEQDVGDLVIENSELRARLSEIEKQAEDATEYVLAQINAELKDENTARRETVRELRDVVLVLSQRHIVDVHGQGRCDCAELRGCRALLEPRQCQHEWVVSSVARKITHERCYYCNETRPISTKPQETESK